MGICTFCLSGPMEYSFMPPVTNQADFVTKYTVCSMFYDPAQDIVPAWIAYGLFFFIIQRSRS